MRYLKHFAGFALAAGMLVGTAGAQDWGYRAYQRQDVRNDYARVAAMRDHIARDRARLNEDIRCGRQAAAARDAADLARDQRALQYQLRDVRHDQSTPRYNSWR